MYPVRDDDIFLPAYMRIRSRIPDSKVTCELVAFGRAYKPFHMLGFVADWYAESA